MPSFLPPVVMELRAEGTQAIAEMAKVGESARAMADKAVLASQREVAAAKESAAQAKAAAEEKTAAADAASKAQSEAAEKTALARKAAAEQEQASIVQINKALAEGTVSAEEAAAEQAKAAEKAAAAVAAAEKEESAAIKATARAQAEAAAAATAASEAEIRAYAAQGAASDAMLAKHRANAKSLVEASNVVSGAALAAAAIIGVAAVEEAAKFQKSTELLVTAGGESQKELGNVRTGIMGIAADTGTATDQLAEGMYVMEKAGYHGADGLKVLRAAAEGAKAENVDLATMTQAVTDVMLDYGKGADQAVSVTNGLVAASGLAKTTMQDFAASMAAIVPTASVAHLSFAQVAGALATMTQHGESAQQSSQNLANLLTQLERPSNIASKAMQQMGIDVTDLSKNIGDENGGRGLLGTLQLMDKAITDHMGKDGLVVQDSMNKSKTAVDDLHKIIAQMPPELAKLSQGFMDGSVSQAAYQKGFKSMGGSANALGNQFLSLAKSSMGVNDLLKSGNPAMMTYVGMWNRAAGGITGARTALMLLMNNSAEFENNIKRITDAEDKNGQHITTWAQTQATFSVQLDMTKQAAANLGIELGNKLLPAAQGLLHGITDVVHGFEQGNPVLLTAAGIIGGALLISTVNLGVKIGKTAVSATKDLISIGKSAMDMASQFHLGFATAGTEAEAGATRMEQVGAKAKGAVPAVAGVAGALGVAAIGLQIVGANSKIVTTDMDKMAKAMADFSKQGDKVGITEMDAQFQIWNETLGTSNSNITTLDGAVASLTHRDFSATINDWADNALQPLVGWMGIGKSEAGQLDDKFKDMGTTLGKMVNNGAADTAAKTFDQLADKFTKNGKTAQDALNTMPGYTQALKDQAAAAGVELSQQELLEYAMGRVPQKMLDAMDSTEKFTDAAGKVKPITPELKKSLDDAGVSADGLVTDLQKVVDGMEAAGLTALSARDADFKLQKSFDDARKSAQDLKDKLGGDLSSALNQTGTDFNKTTEAGQTAEDAFAGVTRQGLDNVKALAANHASQQDVQKAFEDTFNKAKTAAEGFGMSESKADDLTRSVLGIPPGVDIHTWMDNYAKDQADKLTQAVNDIPNQKTVTVVVQVDNSAALDPAQYGNAATTAQASGHRVADANGGLIRRAAGGPVGFADGGEFTGSGPVYGPGTPTSDSVPAMLSNGEYVVKASSVRKYGLTHMEMLNAGALPASGQHPQYAMAGAPTQNVTVNAVTNASPHQIASEVGWALRNQN